MADDHDDQDAARIPDPTPSEQAPPRKTREQRSEEREVRLRKRSAVDILRAMRRQGYWWPGD